MTENILFAARPEQQRQAAIGRQRTQEMQEAAKSQADREKADAKAAHDRTEAGQAGRAAQRIEDEGIIDQANAEDHAATERDREARKAKTQAERTAREAERDAARAARESTPEALGRQREAAQRNEVMGAVQGVNRSNQMAGGQAASPDFLRQVAGQATRNVDMGMQLAAAVNVAIDQVQAKIAADFAKGMENQYRSYQLNGSRY